MATKEALEQALADARARETELEERVADLDRLLDAEARRPTASTYTTDELLEEVRAERDFLRDVVRNLTTDTPEET